ncbi:MAG TPA: sulfotransferase family protein [Cellvibrio sp.]
MSDLFPSYCELVSSPAQLARCQEATSVCELLAIIKNLWQQAALSDDQLLAELAHLNQQVISSANIQLAGHWLPYRYHAKTRSIHWCLPAGHATEPFQDETISRYRQTVLLNQFITPKTALASLEIQAQAVQSITPAGFIFHLSRCGSTLISGCLSELNTTSVFSESPVLTEILLDQTLSGAAHQQHLQQLINLQASVFPTRPDVVIKWNAWDIFRWDLIRAIYPQVPVIFLARNPVEILASHQRSAGRHMSGDPSLADYHPVFAGWDNAGALLEKRVQVLHGLLWAMHDCYPEQGGLVVDYYQLSVDTMATLFQFLNIAFDELGFFKIQARMQFHSKSPGQVFLPDAEKKQSLFTRQQQEKIQAHLSSTYNRLLVLTNNSIGAVINAQ